MVTRGKAKAVGARRTTIIEKLTIKSLRPTLGDRINVLFTDKDEANKAKQRTRWLTSSLAGARFKVE